MEESARHLPVLLVLLVAVFASAIGAANLTTGDGFNVTFVPSNSGARPAVDEAWIAAFADGFFACASEYGVDVIGGDTTRGPLNICITAMGEVEPGRALRRDGAQVGDQVWVSGRPGLAALGLAHLQGKVKLPEPWPRLCFAALEKPRPRVARGTNTLILLLDDLNPPLKFS